MSKVDIADAFWRKSSYSSGNGQCIETAFLGEAVATRDSKDPDGPALVFPADAWRAFVAGVRAGGFPLDF